MTKAEKEAHQEQIRNVGDRVLRLVARTSDPEAVGLAVMKTIDATVKAAYPGVQQQKNFAVILERGRKGAADKLRTLAK